MNRINLSLMLVAGALTLAGCSEKKAKGSDARAVNVDSAALADGFTLVPKRAPTAPSSDPAAAALSASRAFHEQVAQVPGLRPVPAAVRAAADSQLAEIIRRNHEELKQRRGAWRGGAAVSLAPTARPAGVAWSQVLPRIVLRALPLQSDGLPFLAALAVAALPEWLPQQPPAAPSTDVSTVTTHEMPPELGPGGSSARARSERREYRQGDRIGWTLSTQSVIEVRTLGGTIRTVQERTELMETSYCPTAAGLFPGRWDQTDVMSYDQDVNSAVITDLADVSLRTEGQTRATLTGYVDDRSEVMSYDLAVALSDRSDIRENEQLNLDLSKTSHAEGRRVGIPRKGGRAGAVNDGNPARVYVKIPGDLKGVDPERVRESMEGTLSEHLTVNNGLEGLFENGESLRFGGACLEIRMAEKPAKTRLANGERVSLRPQVYHKFDRAVVPLPVSGKAPVGSVTSEGDSTKLKLTYRAPERGAPGAPAWRESGAELTLETEGRRGRAKTALEFSSAGDTGVYRVTVRYRTSSAKFGVVSDYTYEARLVPDPKGSAGELKGTGTYRGFSIGWPANCVTAMKKRSGDRYEARGKLEASGSVIDMSGLAGAGNAMYYVLGTTDWPLMWVALNKSLYAKTAEEKEMAKGLGTIASGKPISLTGAVTTETRTTEDNAAQCGGVITVTEDIRVERK